LQEILLVVDGKVIMGGNFMPQPQQVLNLKLGGSPYCIILAEMEIKVTWTP